MTDYVAMSGGIDSTALALLMPDAELVFTDTQDEFPELYAHLARFESVTGRRITRVSHPDWPGGLPQYIAHYGYLPGHGARFCTRVFKIETYNQFIESKLPATLCIGLRADEPPEERMGNLTDIAGLTIIYPLRDMGIDRVGAVNVCLKHNLLPRYPVYMARGGCRGCFYKRKSEVQAMISLCPDIISELQEREEGVQMERGNFAVMFPNAGASIRQMKQQPLLFAPEDVWRDAADVADKGQACGLLCHR